MSLRSSELWSLLWTRFTWRHARQAPFATTLLVGIVALGVAVFFAVRLANRSAVASFQNFTDVLTAESDGLIQAPSGALPESVLLELRTALAGMPVQLIPVLESTGARPRGRDSEQIGGRETFQLIGVDLIALQNLRDTRPSPRSETHESTNSAAWLEQMNRSGDFWARFRDPRSVFISPALAKRDGLHRGDELPVILNDQVVPLQVAGILPSDPSKPEPPAQLLLMDLPALQRWTGQTGRLTRIEFLLEPGPRRSERWAELRSRLTQLAMSAPGSGSAHLTESVSGIAPRWWVGSPGDRRDQAAIMTRAFRLNLTILSLLALLVGLYLVFQALDGAVVRRREEIAILRSLGVAPRTIQQAWLGEAALLGLVGGIVGLLLGWLGAQGAVRLVGHTVNALYYASSADAAQFAPWEAVLALALAMLTSIIAGWLPAKSAAATPPAQALGRGQSQMHPGPRWLQRLSVALSLAILGLGLLAVPPLRLEGGTRIPIAAYFAALAWVFAGGILGGATLKRCGIVLAQGERGCSRRRSSVPAAATGSESASAPGIAPFAWGAARRLAVSQIREPSGRHRLAVAGLVCAVAMTAGMAILVGSFETTMRGWILRTFQADLYVSSDGAQSASTENRIGKATWERLIAHPAVARWQVIQNIKVQLPEGETMLLGADLGFFLEFARPAWRKAPLPEAQFDPQHAANSDEPWVLVSEAFSERFRLGRGDRIALPTPSGMRSLRIAGVFSDYGNERGSIWVDRHLFVRWYGDELATSVLLVLRPGMDPNVLRAEMKAANPGLAVYTQAYLRSEALRIFRQTFSITYALELIGVVVAVVGLAFTMVSLLWERRGELTTLRALGMREGELAAAAALEGAFTALSGVGVGLLTSLALGWLLIHRVNQQTFGWTLETDWPLAQLMTLAVLVLAAATIAAYYAGRWGAQLPAEREE